MKKRTIYKIIAVTVLGVNFGVVLMTGCTNRPHYQPKAYVAVTKPPMQIIYVDYEKDISAAMVHGLTDQIRNLPYHDYKFNDSSSINIGFDAASHSSHADSTVVNVSN